VRPRGLAMRLLETGTVIPPACQEKDILVSRGTASLQRPRRVNEIVGQISTEGVQP